MPSDSLRLGLITGLLVPLLGFVIYATMYVTGIRPHLTFSYFVNDLFLGTRTYQSPVLSLSLIANLPLFFWYDRKEMPKAMRGVILASFVYAVVVVALWLVAL
ncbi:MAG: hypothetical protein IPI00_02600 [Flavobacteriales bacterium]|nr:hypothetical protein [Flavobacteriales bacterium]MBK6945992.1 hypothetical protein [Flavobacteriales bacterium]MBK7239070.1 hypothetical protein [Flavobacteriales bacterium]MBK7296747.1 hypothetical protein [Flavobacteriales bacterium]MBK9536825.1 hypothetical protein [Flavobacteriales bacterium]